MVARRVQRADWFVSSQLRPTPTMKHQPVFSPSMFFKSEVVLFTIVKRYLPFLPFPLIHMPFISNLEAVLLHETLFHVLLSSQYSQRGEENYLLQIS